MHRVGTCCLVTIRFQTEPKKKTPDHTTRSAMITPQYFYQKQLSLYRLCNLYSNKDMLLHKYQTSSASKEDDDHNIHEETTVVYYVSRTIASNAIPFSQHSPSKVVQLKIRWYGEN